MPHKKHFFVIVNYNSGSHLISAIKSVLLSRNVHPYIIVVDNASRDQSFRQCISTFPDLAYIANPKNYGFGKGANIGIKHALKRGAERITLLNPDAVLHESCMSKIFLFMDQHDIHIASPIIYNNDSVWFSGGYIDFWRMRAVHRIPKDLLLPLPNNSFVSGCVMTISREVFEKIGLFDEKFFLYYEDADFSMRTQKNGFKIAVVKNARAYHEEVSEKNKESKTYFLVLSGLIFFEKHTQIVWKPYFHVHYRLRKLKNYFDLKRMSPLSESVYKALNDYKNIQR